MELQTALLIIPPPEVQAFAAPIRQKYASDVHMQGPAHITLFFPFIPPSQVPKRLDGLKSTCSKVAPFELTLDRYGQFEATHYLAPSNPEPVLSLYRLLLSFYPDYPPYEGQHGIELIPHLTLAHNETFEGRISIPLPPIPSFTFPVDRLHLYFGPSEGNIPWIPIAIIPLKGEE